MQLKLTWPKVPRLGFISHTPSSLQGSPHMHLLGHKNIQELLSPPCPTSPRSHILTHCSVLLVLLKIRALIPHGDKKEGTSQGSCAQGQSGDGKCWDILPAAVQVTAEGEF